MASSKKTYKDVCIELGKICKLFPNWSIANFIKEEEIDINNAPLFYSQLKEYRERLELDNHVITNDDEMKQILEDGLHIHSVIIKEEMYGED